MEPNIAQILKDLASRAREICAEKNGSDPYPIPIKRIGEYIAGSHSVKYLITDDSGWGHNKRNVILRFCLDGMEWYGIWWYRGGSCSGCDSDQSLSDRIDNMEREQALKTVSDDLEAKIQRGKLFRRFDDLIQHFQYDEELYQGLRGCVPASELIPKELIPSELIPKGELISVDSETPVESDPVESTQSQHELKSLSGLIGSNTSANIVTILNEMNVSLSENQIRKLDSLIEEKLPQKERWKDYIPNSRTKYYANVYEPDELSSVEKYVVEFLTENKT